MLDANDSKVLDLIRPGDIVLDVGGWARSFNRANYVMDAGPYETHGLHYKQYQNSGPQGGAVEHFTAETWIQRDICDREPWPFPDKFFDYCTCSHTLEDIRDPIWVCSEMVRVAKRGYIEFPSILFEMTRGREDGVPVGLCHHRWLIDVTGNEVTFMPKMHYIHGDRRLSVPPQVGWSAPDELLVSYLFWEGEFSFRESGMTREDMAAVAARLNPEGIVEETEIDRMQAELDATRAELARTQQQNGMLHDRLRLFEGVGASGVKLARRIHRISSRHPRITSLIRRVTRVA
ncbi:class I SAM-dependent methyltransferase [Singulisphaera sp. PoT]|uniref:class I SAM-dependent methyltransferase n=1 Tax=Singulisphaera sp. PoT TaxID=3411797 RepID=UPI003BF58DAB